MNIIDSIHKVVQGRCINRNSTLTRSEKIMYHGAILTIGLALLTIVYIYYLLLWPFQVTRFKSITTAKSTYSNTEPISLILDYCKTHDYIGHVVPELIGNGGRYFLRDFDVNLPIGCYKMEYKSDATPPTLAPGEYKVRMTIIYEVNKLRTITKEQITNSFTIL
jgi:hypothetical protein